MYRYFIYLCMFKYRYKRICFKDLRLNFKMFILIGILLLSLVVGGKNNRI